MSESQPGEWRPDELIAAMVARNRQLWELLERAGVTEETELRLEFFYDSAGDAGDAELAEFLGRETDYEVHRTSENYGIIGSTKPTTVSRQILDEWVDWMVIAGYVTYTFNRAAPRFVRNFAGAVPLNNWLIVEPNEGIDPDALYRSLQTRSVREQLHERCRVYGGGLWKLEPSELVDVRVGGKLTRQAD